MEYAIIFMVVVVALSALVAGHEATRIRIARNGGKGRRIAAILASAAAAYVLACAPAFVLLAVYGGPGERHYAVGELLDGYDAAGKLRPGDIILSVDGHPVAPAITPSLGERVDESNGAPVTLTIRRDGAGSNVAIEPKREGARWLLGIRIAFDVERDTRISHAIAGAGAFPIDRAQQEVRLIGELFDEPDAGGPKRIVDEWPRSVVSEPGWVRGLTGAMSACFFALLALLAIDLVRLVRAAVSRG